MRTSIHTHTHPHDTPPPLNQGTVDAYDADTGLHRVYYADGSEEE